MELLDRDKNILERIQSAHSSFKGKTLGEIAAEIASVKRIKNYLEDVNSELVNYRKDLVRSCIELMEKENVDKYTTNDGDTITRNIEVRGVISNSIDFFLWLAERKEEDLGRLQLSPLLMPDNIKEIVKQAHPADVKMTVHWKKLAAYLKEVCDLLDASTYPNGIEIETWEDLRLTLKD